MSTTPYDVYREPRTSTSTLMGPSLNPGRELPPSRLTMPHIHVLMASEACVCPHWPGPAHMVLPTHRTHTHHFQHYYACRCGHRRSTPMHTRADLLHTHPRHPPTALSLHHIEYSLPHTCQRHHTMGIGNLGYRPRHSWVYPSTRPTA